MNNPLLELGLTQNEIDVYTGFLKNPDKTSAQISRILSMDKSSVYRATEELERNGLLISSPKKKGTTYIASDPEVLSQIHKRKISSLKSQTKQLNSLIDTLKKEKHSRALNIRVEYGLEAVKQIMNESHSSKEKLIRERFRHHSFFEDEEHVDFVNNYAKERVKNGIRILQLEYDLQSLATRFKEIMTQHKRYLKEVRFLPKEMDDMNSLRIWDNTTNIVSEDENGEIIVITIEDKLITDLMKNMFDFIWGKSDVFRPDAHRGNGRALIQ